MTRLQTLAPGIASSLQHAPVSKQHAASIMACEFAISRAGIEHPLVERALDKIRLSQPLNANERSELESLEETLDEQYFDLQEAAEAGSAEPEQYMRAFSQARAVSALIAASHDDSLEASSEAIYEAASTTDEPEDLLGMISTLLSR